MNKYEYLLIYIYEYMNKQPPQKYFKLYINKCHTYFGEHLIVTKFVFVLI